MDKSFTAIPCIAAYGLPVGVLNDWYRVSFVYIQLGFVAIPSGRVEKLRKWEECKRDVSCALPL